jgi:hypothetical protein
MLNSGRESFRQSDNSIASHNWNPSGNRQPEVGNKLGKLIAYLPAPKQKFTTKAYCPLWADNCRFAARDKTVRSSPGSGRQTLPNPTLLVRLRADYFS